MSFNIVAIEDKIRQLSEILSKVEECSGYGLSTGIWIVDPHYLYADLGPEFLLYADLVLASLKANKDVSDVLRQNK